MAEAQVATTNGGKKKHKMFEIEIGLGNDNDPVRQFVGADGMDFLIERGKKVIVPEPVLGVLDNAVQGVQERSDDDTKAPATVLRKRFPYTIVRAL
jgi:hypothetical protein